MNKIKDKLNTAKLFFLTRIYSIRDDNRGMGVIEIVLIILVLVGLVVIFRTQITGIINSVFSKITRQINNF